MPNGGLDNCGVCGFNRANEGVWGRADYTADERLDNAFCTIRGVKIHNALWTYCANCESKHPAPDGPSGYLYPRIPWHGVHKPTLNVVGTCSRCGRFAEKGIAIQADDAEMNFCCNGHYVKWWREQNPNESFRWDHDKWPEPSGQS
jgi:hypothetical protein